MSLLQVKSFFDKFDVYGDHRPEMFVVKCCVMLL